MALFLDFSLFFLKTSFSFFLSFLKRRRREEELLFSHFFSPFLKKKKKGKGEGREKMFLPFFEKKRKKKICNDTKTLEKALFYRVFGDVKGVLTTL